MPRVHPIYDQNGKKFRRQVNKLESGIHYIKRNNNLYIVEEIGEKKVISSSSVTTKIYQIVGEAKITL